MNKNRSLNNLNGDVRDGFSGFDDLSKELFGYIQASENAIDILEVGADAFTKDLLKLPKPMSAIRKSGYTHLIDSFTYERSNERFGKGEVIVGWGKYYGRMVEKGTEKMDEMPHMYPLWDRNKEKYYNLMLSKIKMIA